MRIKKRFLSAVLITVFLFSGGTQAMAPAVPDAGTEKNAATAVSQTRREENTAEAASAFGSRFPFPMRQPTSIQ